MVVAQQGSYSVLSLWKACLLAVALMMLLLPSELLANAGVNGMANSLNANHPFNKGGHAVEVSECLHNSPGGMSDENWNDKYSVRFVYCMRKLLVNATETIITEVQDYMRPAVYSVIALFVALLGVRAVGGIFRNPKAELATAIAKVIAVLVMFENVEIAAEVVFVTTDQMLALVGNAARGTFNTNTYCDLPAFTGENAAWLNVFDQLDCMTTKLIGAGTNAQVITGLGSVLSAAMWSGTSGAHMTAMAVSFIVGMLIFLLRATLMVVMAYGALGMLLIFLPVFVLTIFFKMTETYFYQRWTSYVVSNIVQTSIMIGFLFFAVAALDQIIYSGSPGVHYKLDANNNVQITNTAGVGTDQVIVPLWVPLGVNPEASLSVQLDQMERNFTGPEKLFEFKMPDNPEWYAYFRSKCGAMGDTNVSNWDLFKDVSSAAWDKAYCGLFSDCDAVKRQLERVATGQSNLGGKEILKVALCHYGKEGIVTQSVNSYTESFINKYIPNVYRVELYNNPTAKPDMAGGDEHEYNMMKLKAAIFALLILSGTFYTYTNSLPQIARTITGKLGMGLSMAGPSAAAGMLTKGVQLARQGWVQNIKNGEGTITDNLGKAGRDMLSGMMGKR